MGLLTRTKEKVPCTVTVSHRFEELSAHVRFDNGAVVHPGDTVEVQGPEIMAAFGEKIEEHRTAVITRASGLERLWTRATGDLEFMELCEFSFSEEFDGMNVQTPELAHSADAKTAEEGLNAQNFDTPVDSKMATELAMQNTLLTPRFYTTDFEELDSINVEPVREEWDALIAQMKADPNKGHFKKNEDWDHIDWEGMDPALRRELIDFLISSCTAEFSGCVLYKEMKRRGSNHDVTTLFQLMARDEARHAGFINDALREAGIAVNLGFLTQAKKYTYFRPKFIYYATYLSEKIGYARYITIYRHLEANPDKRFHPIFKWFREWCNDEFSHGEAFALLMRTDPQITNSFVNKLWIKFFLTAVFGTMWVRDHQRPAFHEALGVDPAWYGQEVFDKTTEISRQVFPLTLDMENPRWRRGLERLDRANRQIAAAKKRGGAGGKLASWWGSARAGMAFAGLLLIPSKKNVVPESSRMEPAY